MLEQIVKIAIVGTEKKFFDEQQQTLLQSWGLTNTTDKEQVLLYATAIASKMEKAGYMPRHEQKLNMIPAPAEKRPAIGQRSSTHLRILLGEKDHELFIELLQLIQQHRQRIDYSFLPEILDWGKLHKEAQVFIREVVGARGQWLAQFQEDWVYVLPEETLVDWETASFEERKAYLKRVRERQGQEAAALLASTWETEEPAHKAILIDMLQINLSMEDEPFLIQAAKDSRKEVRTIAYDLMAQLKESAFKQRLEAYLTSHVFVKKSLLKGTTIEVKLPQNYDQELKSLGVAEKINLVKGGQKANWLAQIIMRIHPSFWEKLLAAEANAAIKIIKKSEWDTLLLPSITQAAILHKAQPWLQSLIQECFGAYEINWKNVVQALDQDTYHWLIQFYLRKGPETLLMDQPLYHLLDSGEGPIRDTVAQPLITLFRETVQRSGQQWDHSAWYISSLLRKLAKRIHPSQTYTIVQGWPESSALKPHWVEAINIFQRWIAFRKDMYQGFTDN